MIDSTTPSHFLPAPYCDHLAMRRVLYAHAFPSPSKDTSLVLAFQNDLLAARHFLALTPTEISVTRIVSPTSPGQALPTMNPNPSHGAVADYVQKLDALSKSVTDDTFSDFDLSLPLPPNQTGSFVPNPAPDLQIGTLVAARWQTAQEIVRRKLLAGEIKVFYKNQGAGIVALENSNLWLDDLWSHDALVEGQITPFDANPSIKSNSLFDSRELAQFLPKYSAKTNGKPRRKATRVVKVGDWLSAAYPTGRPINKVNLILLKEAEQALGVKLSETTFKSAIKRIGWT